MSRIPEPEQTPDGPAYEGRLLPDPNEEVVDQGVRFDIATVLTRRRVLSLVGVGAGVAALAACAPTASSDTSSGSTPSATTDSTSTSSATATPSPTSTAVTELPSAEIPDETNGPYPADGTNGPDVLEESGVVRSDIRTTIDGTVTAVGVPMTLTMTITDMANDDAPYEGAAVYIWQCDAAGLYSMYSSGVEDIDYLRGVQVADANGQVTFTTIFPACYSGRWPHIHFEVYPSVDSITDQGNNISVSQMALPEDVCNDVYALDEYAGSTENMSRVSIANDGVFDEDTIDLQMVTISGDVASGYIASLTARVDATTEADMGDMGDMGGGGGPGGDGGGPGGTPPGGN